MSEYAVKQQEEEEEEEDDLYYFESDHLALKGNRDYSEVLKTLFVLEAQRERAIKDYNTVVEIQRRCLDDPLSVVEKLKNGEPLGVPDLQRIAEVPVINWSKYSVQIPEEGLKFLNATSKHTPKEKNSADSLDRSKTVHNTHKKPWTTEEQKRLEELLLLYPPEPIEYRRFKKIAAALGNRTVTQVTSRVQKYFLKLYQANLPIPGRIPKSAEKHKKSSLHKHQRHNHYLWKPTTFFPSLNIPVVMGENDDAPGPSSSNGSKVFCDDYSTLNPKNYLLPSGYHDGSETVDSKNKIVLQLELLKRVKQEKQREETSEGQYFEHDGYKCDYCEEEPIIGSRWHCVTCEGSVSVDFCTDCIISQLHLVNCHPLTHKLVVVQDDKTVINNNYMESSSDSSDSETDENTGNSSENASNNNNKSINDGFIGAENNQNCQMFRENEQNTDSNTSFALDNSAATNDNTIMDGNYFDSAQNSSALFDMDLEDFHYENFSNDDGLLDAV